MHTIATSNSKQVVVEHVAVMLAAAAVAVGVFLLGREVLGVDVDTREPARVTAGSVLGTTVVATGLGWALLMALRHWTSGGDVLWRRIAITVAAVSLLGPLTTPDLTGGGRVLLVVLHVVVAATVIGGLTRPAAPRR